MGNNIVCKFMTVLLKLHWTLVSTKSHLNSCLILVFLLKCLRLVSVVQIYSRISKRSIFSIKMILLLIKWVNFPNPFLRLNLHNTSFMSATHLSLRGNHNYGPSKLFTHPKRWVKYFNKMYCILCFFLCMNPRWWWSSCCCLECGSMCLWKWITSDHERRAQV